MKANEIMMGDYARINKDVFPLKKDTIVQVLSIVNSHSVAFSNNSCPMKIKNFGNFVKDIWVQCVFHEQKIHVGIFHEYLDPIPLTVEILKKYGFEMALSEVQKYILWEHKYTVFAKNIDNEAWEIDIFSKECKLPYQSAIVYHVHQLQQWLRFCGIEREIKMSSLTSINTI